MRGRFVVIEGTDGSGKATQTALLVQRLSDDGLTVRTFDFPQYESGSAFFVKRYLNGEYGGIADLDPKVVCTFYALDRYDASHAMRESLSRGDWVVANRYVTANKGHQAGKALDPDQRADILSFIDSFEYGLLGLPREDLVLLLFVPPIVGQRLVDEKAKRSYTEKKRDLHEADLDHLEQAAQAYLEVAKKDGWNVINCLYRNDFSRQELLEKPLSELMKTPQEIHEEVLSCVLLLLDAQQ
jgi:dTMP kinase